MSIPAASRRQPTSRVRNSSVVASACGAAPPDTAAAAASLSQPTGRGRSGHALRLRYPGVHADVAQLVEHQLPKLRVVGSSPIVRSRKARSGRFSSAAGPGGHRLRGEVTADEDIATVASQLADLTRTVAEMETQLRALRERADTQQERAEQQREHTEIQQERIDLAARELAEVSARLQAAANALRASI
jgi:hypothetical protein